MKQFAIACLMLLSLLSHLTIAEVKDPIDQSLIVLADFTRNIRFDEQDMENFVTYWEEASALEELGEDEDGTLAVTEFDEIANDPQYREWAISRNLNPLDFLQKSMRIYAVHFRTTFPAQAKEMRAEMNAEALAEALPEGLSAEDKKKMQDLFQAGREGLAAMERSVQKLPEPSASEKELLEAYQDQLWDLLGNEEEDEQDGDFVVPPMH